MSDFKSHSIGVKPKLELVKTVGDECSKCKERNYAIINQGVICTNCNMFYPNKLHDIEQSKKVSV